MKATDDDEHGKNSGERIDISSAMRRASAQLSELLRCEPGSVSAVKSTDEGWSADVEVVELEKVPDTMTVMASYHVTLDPQGRLLAYERTRRYARGQIDRR
ncbi:MULTISPECIES: gas vesicle protein GvpO [Streptomyces]|uniref:Gas vesicle protein n=1 Tax=Streptomyces lateritius TaxID=67313 RepID=A0ABW6YJB8_9ACTN|nr:MULTISPECIES: gas vesicle protein [Streptomyces]QGZ52350.1 gas vesicle protein [Streptomyces sp. QHH-9511]